MRHRAGERYKLIDLWWGWVVLLDGDWVLPVTVWELGYRGEDVLVGAGYVGDLVAHDEERGVDPTEGLA